MSEEDDFLQKARIAFEDLCRALNMDEEASNEAWKTYENISRNFTLEVNTYSLIRFPTGTGLCRLLFPARYITLASCYEQMGI